MTRSTRSVEDLKDEFYLHCKDYVEKKKIIAESNRQLEERVNQEKRVKAELQIQIDNLQKDIKEMQAQLANIFNDLDISMR